MKPGVLILLGLWLATPATGQTLPTMLGTWSGDGTSTRGDEPADRFRCRVRLVPDGTMTALFSGRCATAQGQQSFTYLMIEREDGTVSAQNRSDPPDTLPERLIGTAAQGVVHLQDGAGGLFEFALDGATLRLRVEGTEGGLPTRGEARLTRQE